MASQAKGGDRKLRHGARRRLKPKRSAWSSRHSVTVMVDGVNAGIVGESELSQNRQRPHGTVDHRVGGRAIAGYRLSRNLFDDILGTPGIFPKFVGLKFVDQAMPVG